MLLWKTFGVMINAGVMGLVAPLRFILLTDGLVERMPVERIEAVMAHEVAHVSKRHIFWLIVTPGLWIGSGGLLGWISVSCINSVCIMCLLVYGVVLLMFILLLVAVATCAWFTRLGLKVRKFSSHYAKSVSSPSDPLKR